MPRAWRLTGSGDVDVLALEEFEVPALGPLDVQVGVHAAGLNRADILQRRGIYPAPAGAPADIPGLEYAGRVEAVGARVTHRKPGDRVMGLVGGGAYAEQLVVNERETIAIPAGLSDTDAAATTEAFLTAYRALFIEGGLNAGDWCLIRAATSGIGIAAMQLSRYFGCRSIGTGRNRERLEAVAGYGLDALAVDGEDTLSGLVAEHAGDGVAVVLDLIGGSGAVKENLASLRPEGVQVLVGLMAGPKDQINLAPVLFRRLTLRAMTMRSLPLERRIELAQLFERRLSAAFSNGALRPVVDTTLPFEQAREAQQLMESGRHTGKIVLRMDGPGTH
ncbi:NAD(P)H-quinone oxidoreductase [Methylonatrum kenyense]|uniref:NAD(P)H-quinone oxidoreductase n=1 Tax=Methylonatrum kenyense TaxID=455253 RepID=UPI0020BE27E9|nr:NAD(P)H-quinone oxidoreductase [Methylonatrum kenyense]MCK8517153.1 NAD(P)H-quinone oxidoreductase [Methylonatrum kenyense]